MKLVWKKLAIKDRDRIMDDTAKGNPQAALDQDERFEDKAEGLLKHPELYRQGRKRGTREMTVEPYIVIYRVKAKEVEILRVKHEAQQWP